MQYFYYFCAVSGAGVALERFMEQIFFIAVMVRMV